MKTNKKIQKTSSKILEATSDDINNCGHDRRAIMSAVLVYQPLRGGGGMVLKNRWGRTGVCSKEQLDRFKTRTLAEA